MESTFEEDEDFELYPGEKDDWDDEYEGDYCEEDEEVCDCCSGVNMHLGNCPYSDDYDELEPW